MTRAVSAVGSRARRALALAGTVAIVTVGSTVGIAQAHHAWNEVDTARVLTLTGIVKILKWENPHASLVLETVDGDTRVEWTVMMSGLARMEGRGVEQRTVAVGRTLTVAASPARGERHVVRANRISGDGHDYVLY